MYQRLLLTLTVLFISGISMAQNVITSTDGDYIYSAGSSNPLLNPTPAGTGVMQKWVHDPNQPGKSGRITWDQTKYKSYRFNNTSFRLRFPNNYDSTKKYPCVIFLHGAGEAASNTASDNTLTVDRENQDQLYWGGQLFGQRVDAGEWNGFLLFPQLLIAADGAGSQWDDNTFPNVNNILDTLTKYNGLDKDRILVMGLSAGGVGAITYAADHPDYIASVVSSSPKEIEGLIPSISNFEQIPLWVATGGIDTGPDPATSLKSRDSIAAHGANIFLSYYPTAPHQTWDTMWVQKDIYNNNMLSNYWNAAHKAQPLVYFQNTQFCTGQPISAKMALTPGFAAYEWQYDNGGGFATIPGATAYTYTATLAGRYQVHFKRNVDSAWSAWTPAPVVISTKTCTTDTAFAEHFETTPINPYTTFSGGPVFGNSPYFYQNFTCQNGIFVNGTEIFSQDASGRQGGRFMLNNTTPSTSCSYFAGDQVWRTYSNATVTPNTNYLFSFYMGNQASTPTASPASPLTQLVAKINGVALSPVGAQAVLAGDISWKKYSYIWNSGTANSAELAITNNTTSGAGNNFVLDEISLVTYTPPAMPAGVNTTLWSQANSITGYNGSAVRVWTNNDINGNNLQQNTMGREPLLKINANDNINFNPVVAYSTALNNYNFVTGGFSGTATHSAAHVYIVTKSTSTASGQTIFSEGETTGGALGFATTTNGRLTWSAGSGSNLLSTATNANEAGKPILWSLSKDNTNGTADGNRQDIRKNGLAIASSAAITTFKGNNSNFRLGTTATTGTFNGSIAEIIYLLDSVVTPLTQNRIESYLALKYGTSLGTVALPVNYTASDSTTVFWTKDTKYQNDVFGIGTDSVSGLVQARSNSANSGSGDGTGQSAKGNLVLATNTALADKSFLMIGNDAGPLTEHIIANGEAAAVIVGSTRITRNWKVNNTNSTGVVDLSFDTTGLGKLKGQNGLSNYALMVDNDGDGNYNTGTLSFINATSAAGTKINFSGITLNNGVVFTVLTFKLSTTLPAVWLGFTAEAVNGNGVLNWKTSDEINVDRYTVEHSFNGVSFTAISYILAYNNSGINLYNYTDANLAPGVHYYRIRRTDKDGKIEYSDIKSIKITTTGANVQVRPNPVVGAVLALAVSVQQSSKTSIQVMDVAGKIIARQNISLVAGNNMVNINISSVPPGIYLVQVQLSDEVVTKKFIKQR